MDFTFRFAYVKLFKLPFGCHHRWERFFSHPCAQLDDLYAVFCFLGLGKRNEEQSEMKKRFFAGLLSFLILSGFITTNSYAAVDYSSWDRVLKTYVNAKGLVNYEALKENPEDLDGFIRIIKETDVAVFSPQEKKAFWINAYNALTLWVVRDKYPVSSIRRISFGLVWERKRLVARGKYSLGHIEHKILRPLGDPRIHFSLNCASIGCPKLRREHFSSNRLDAQ